MSKENSDSQSDVERLVTADDVRRTVSPQRLQYHLDVVDEINRGHYVLMDNGTVCRVSEDNDVHTAPDIRAVPDVEPFIAALMRHELAQPVASDMPARFNGAPVSVFPVVMTTRGMQAIAGLLAKLYR